MSLRESVRTLFGLGPVEFWPADLGAFDQAVVGTATRHYGLTEPFFDGRDWRQMPARFLAVSGAYRLDRGHDPVFGSSVRIHGGRL